MEYKQKTLDGELNVSTWKSQRLQYQTTSNILSAFSCFIHIVQCRKGSENCEALEWTYVVCTRSWGLSAASGKTGWGGSPIGIQPRDLLMAWLSFFAGDFCKTRRTRPKSYNTPNNYFTFFTQTKSNVPTSYVRMEYFIIHQLIKNDSAKSLQVKIQFLSR